jgi:aspartate beta-hydroxylase
MSSPADLLAQAQSALARNDPERAAQALDAVLRADPGHPGALRGLAAVAMRRGDHAGAAEALRRVVAADPGQVDVRLGLAVALAQAGDLAAACAELEAALQRQPEFLSARLHLGMYLVDRGETDRACTEFSAALATAMRLPESARAVPQIQHLIQLARTTIRDRQWQVYREAVAGLRAETGDAALSRIDECVDVYLRRRAPAYTHDKQRPATLYIPRLQPRPFFEREEFPWIGELEAGTAVIREELLALLRDEAGFEPYVQLPADHPQAASWAAVNNARDWSAFHLFRHGRPNEENAARCPRTLAILAKLPLMSIPNHAPEVVLSLLKPGAHIPPHYGSVNGRLIVHLPLIVPPNCGYLCAAGEKRAWEEGRCLIFDDSFVHEAWNDSDLPRVVMLLDIWNPQLSDAERRGFSAALESIDRFNVDVLRRGTMAFQ